MFERFWMTFVSKILEVICFKDLEPKIIKLKDWSCKFSAIFPPNELKIPPLIVVTVKFTYVYQQNAQVTPISWKCGVAVKNINDNLNTHDFQYWYNGYSLKLLLLRIDKYIYFVCKTYFGIGAFISAHQEIYCLPYTGFLLNWPTALGRFSCNICDMDVCPPM